MLGIVLWYFFSSSALNSVGLSTVLYLEIYLGSCSVYLVFVLKIKLKPFKHLLNFVNNVVSIHSLMQLLFPNLV